MKHTLLYFCILFLSSSCLATSLTEYSENKDFYTREEKGDWVTYTHYIPGDSPQTMLAAGSATYLKNQNPSPGPTEHMTAYFFSLQARYNKQETRKAEQCAREAAIKGSEEE